MRDIENAPFMSWLVSGRTLEQGLVDTLADIIKDQLYVNPLAYLEAGHGFEVHLCALLQPAFRMIGLLIVASVHRCRMSNTQPYKNN